MKQAQKSGSLGKRGGHRRRPSTLPGEPRADGLVPSDVFICVEQGLKNPLRTFKCFSISLCLSPDFLLKFSQRHVVLIIAFCHCQKYCEQFSKLPLFQMELLQFSRSIHCNNFYFSPWSFQISADSHRKIVPYLIIVAT